MSFEPEMIDLTTSSSSSSESDGWSRYFPPSVLPLIPRLTKEQASKKKHDVGEISKLPNIATSDSAGLSDRSPSRVANQTTQRDRVFPFLCTSDAESEDNDDEDPLYFPPSSSVRPKNRPWSSNQTLQKSMEVVAGLPAPLNGLSAEEGRWKIKGMRWVQWLMKIWHATNLFDCSACSTTFINPIIQTDSSSLSFELFNILSCISNSH